jgi:hypothetical protein
MLLISGNAICQQKKPVPKKPATPTPAKVETRPSQKEQQELLLKLQKAKEDSLTVVEEAKKKIERELLEERLKVEREEQQKKQRYEDALRQEKEANDRRLAEQALLDAKKLNNEFGYGFKFGRSFSTLSTSELGSINKTYLPAFTYGLLLNIPLGKKIALMPEINYISKGLRYEYEADFDQLKMNYVALPLMVRADIISSPLYRIYAKVGGYGSYWLNGKLQSEIDGTTSEFNYEFDNDFEDGFADNRLDYGASGGVGFSVKIRQLVLNLEGRYDYGLSPVSKMESTPNNYVQPVNQSLNICLSIQF